MKLEEMQAALDSAARQEKAKLEKENKHLMIAIRKKQEHIDKIEKALKEMFLRCIASYGHGACDDCKLRQTCDHLTRNGGNKQCQNRVR